MKRIIRILCIATLLLAAASAFAQNERSGQRRNEWREKMKTEKIGFLTSEIGLTSEEAKLFWPVYEKIEAAREAAMERSFKAFQALERSLREEKGEAAIAEALNEYLAAGEERPAVCRRVPAHPDFREDRPAVFRRREVPPQPDQPPRFQSARFQSQITVVISRKKHFS